MGADDAGGGRLLVTGGEVLTPAGWRFFDLLLDGGRIVTARPVVGRGGETVDGVGGHAEGDPGGAGAARGALLSTVEGDAVTAARDDNLAAGGLPSRPTPRPSAPADAAEPDDPHPGPGGPGPDRGYAGASGSGRGVGGPGPGWGDVGGLGSGGGVGGPGADSGEPGGPSPGRGVGSLGPGPGDGGGPWPEPDDRWSGDIRVCDARGLRVVPGLVDLQCNGGWGIDLATEPERLWELAALLPATGVTAWLPTIVTGPPGARRRALAAWRSGPPPALAGRPLATPLGLHFEGPFLAPERAGAHDRRWLCSPDAGGAALVAGEGWSRRDGVALVTLAPELPGALDVVRELRGRGIVASAGHSEATAAEAEAGVDAGITWVTHLFNAMAPLHHREPGLAGVALTDPRVRVGLIADGIHVHPRAVALAAAALGDRLTLVTDAVAALGLPPGPVRLGRLEARAAPDGVRLADGTLAGSALAMHDAVANLRRFAGADPAAAVHAASAGPAALLADASPDGEGVRRGVIAAGAAADLVLLDDAGDVVATVVGGRVAHDRRR